MTLYVEPVADRARGLAAVLGPRAQAAATLDELAALVRADRAEQLVVLGAGVPLSEALAFTGQQRLSHPTLGVLLLRDQVDVALMADAIRAGVREVVDARDGDALRAACARSLEVSRQMSGQGGGPA
jgi:pilus assembly protein CpaE